MIAAAFPPNETLRIQALYRARLLDSIPDECVSAWKIDPLSRGIGVQY